MSSCPPQLVESRPKAGLGIPPRLILGAAPITIKLLQCVIEAGRIPTEATGARRRELPDRQRRRGFLVRSASWGGMPRSRCSRRLARRLASRNASSFARGRCSRSALAERLAAAASRAARRRRAVRLQETSAKMPQRPDHQPLSQEPTPFEVRHDRRRHHLLDRGRCGSAGRGPAGDPAAAASIAKTTGTAASSRTRRRRFSSVLPRR